MNDNIYKIKSVSRDVMRVLKETLIWSDILLKVGAITYSWFFQLPENDWARSICLLIFIVALSIISKGLYKVKELEATIESCD